MKRQSSKRKLLKILLLVFAIFCGLILIVLELPKAPVYYQSPAVSAVIVDAYTGQPLEGAAIQVSWSALRHDLFEGSDLLDIHTATAVTDKNGLATIPAWGPVAVAKEWIYYEFDPKISFSKPGYKSDYLDNHNHQDSVTPDAKIFSTVTLELPAWAGNVLELHRLDNYYPPTSAAAPPSSIPDEVLANSLTYYVVHKEMVEGGKYIDTPDFPEMGYIRPKPELIITKIQSFSSNITIEHFNWFAIGIPLVQRQTTGFSVTLFTNDARKAAELERNSIERNNLVLMIGQTPLAESYMAMNGSETSTIPIPTGPLTIYLPLRKQQNIQEISDALKKLVQSK